MKQYLALILLGTVLSSCGSVPQQLDPKLFYKRDLTVEVGGVDYTGVSVLPDLVIYDMLIKPVGKMDLLLITTCHREDSFNPKSTGFFTKDNTFQYQYEPQAGIENDGSCPLRINAFDKDKGQHSWFFADFNGKESLPALVTCNGRATDYGGVSVCQSKAGLIQRIDFNEPVTYYPPTDCPMPSDLSDGYKLNLGECVYAFRGESGRTHRHTTIGYEGVLVREMK
jgi:hypothetical protein